MFSSGRGASVCSHEDPRGRLLWRRLSRSSWRELHSRHPLKKTMAGFSVCHLTSSGSRDQMDLVAGPRASRIPQIFGDHDRLLRKFLYKPHVLWISSTSMAFVKVVYPTTCISAIHNQDFHGHSYIHLLREQHQY